MQRNQPNILLLDFCNNGGIGSYLLMHYLINLSEETDHLLHRLCDPRQDAPGDAISPEEFLSAFVEQKLGDLFAHRERPKTGRNNGPENAVRSAKGRAEAWSEASVATHTALRALQKLVLETVTSAKTAHPSNSRW